LQAFKISEEDDIFACKCDLIRDLIMAGANIKF
jgi:hypothetical protein